MDGPPNTALPKLSASNERLRTNVHAIARRGAVTAGVTEDVRRPAPPARAPRPKTGPKKTTLGALSEALSGGEALPDADNEFNPSSYLREHTTEHKRTGAGLASAALGRMFKRR